MDSSTRPEGIVEEDAVVREILGEKFKRELTPAQSSRVIVNVLGRLKPKLGYMPLESLSAATETFDFGKVKGEARVALTSLPWPDPTPKKAKVLAWQRGQMDDSISFWVRLLITDDGRLIKIYVHLQGSPRFGAGAHYLQVPRLDVEVVEFDDLEALLEAYRGFDRQILNSFDRLWSDAIQTRKIRLKAMIEEANWLCHVRERSGCYVGSNDWPKWALDVVTTNDLSPERH